MVNFIAYYLLWNNLVNVIVYYLLLLMQVWIFILYNSFRITCYPIASDLTPSKGCKLLAALNFTHFAQSFVVTSSIFHPLQYRWWDRVYKLNLFDIYLYCLSYLFFRPLLQYLWRVCANSIYVDTATNGQKIVIG